MIRFLAAAGVLLIAGCGQEEATQPSTTAPPTAPVSTAPPPTVAVTTMPTSSTVPVQTTTAGRVVAGSITVPNMVGQDLQLAQDSMQAIGLYSLRSHDATGQGRAQVLDRAWKVCDQAPPAGSAVAADQLIDFGAVRDEEQCP